jgi:hypothetical protein
MAEIKIVADQGHRTQQSFFLKKSEIRNAVDLQD